MRRIAFAAALLTTSQHPALADCSTTATDKFDLLECMIRTGVRPDPVVPVAGDWLLGTWSTDCASLPSRVVYAKDSAGQIVMSTQRRTTDGWETWAEGRLIGYDMKGSDIQVTSRIASTGEDAQIAFWLVLIRPIDGAHKRDIEQVRISRPAGGGPSSQAVVATNGIYTANGADTPVTERCSIP